MTTRVALRRFEKGLSHFDRAFMAVSMISLLAMLATVCIDAAGRYLFMRPLRGSYQIVSLYTMVALTFMALPRTYAIGGMIRVELFTGVLKRWFGLWPERLNALVALIAFGALAWVTGNEALAKFAARETTLGTVQFPMYWSFVWVPLGSALLCVRIALHVIDPELGTEGGVRHGT